MKAPNARGMRAALAAVAGLLVGCAPSVEIGALLMDAGTADAGPDEASGAWTPP